MSDVNQPAPVKAKMKGCDWVVLIFAAVMALGAPVLQSFIAACHPKEKKIHSQTVIKGIQYAVLNYEADYHHFPIPASDRHGPDVSIRSRGPMLTALMGEDAALNPRGIKFIDHPAAKDRKNGFWQDGAEWVLSDRWGEPYYIVLDTNGDGKVANPEFGADQSDADYAKRCQENPPPATLPLKVLIYSSGPDRDPKTWEDNVCSWYSR